MKHLLNVIAHASVALFILLALGLGTALHGSIALAAPLAVAIGALTVLAGTFGLIAIRMVFGLMQTGRLASIAIFGLLGAGWIKLASLALPGLLTLTATPLLPGFATVALVVVLAFASGNIKSFARRTWLPMRMPKQPPTREQ